MPLVLLSSAGVRSDLEKMGCEVVSLNVPSKHASRPTPGARDPAVWVHGGVGQSHLPLRMHINTHSQLTHTHPPSLPPTHTSGLHPQVGSTVPCAYNLCDCRDPHSDDNDSDQDQGPEQRWVCMGTGTAAGVEVRVRTAAGVGVDIGGGDGATASGAIGAGTGVARRGSGGSGRGGARPAVAVAVAATVPADNSTGCTGGTGDHCDDGTDRLCLDVSTMMVLVSDLTNVDQSLPEELAKGPFASTPIELMASHERVPHTRVLPILLPLLHGKPLAACSAAVQAFTKIVDEIGGPAEQARAAALLPRIELLDDTPSARCMALRPSGKIKRVSQIVFGTSDQLRLKTVSANRGFVRAAQGQGCRLSVIAHDGRALSGSARRVREQPQPVSRRPVQLYQEERTKT